MFDSGGRVGEHMYCPVSYEIQRLNSCRIINDSIKPYLYDSISDTCEVTTLTSVTTNAMLGGD